MIDTEELFRFLSQFDKYPAHGHELARAAKDHGFSTELQHFLNFLPGEIRNSAEITAAAFKPEVPPYDETVDAVHSTGTEAADETLNIDDIDP